MTKGIILLYQVSLIVWKMKDLKKKWLLSSLALISSIDVTEEDTEACHLIGKADRFKSNKTVIRFINRKHWKTAFENRRQLVCPGFTKYQFPGNTKIFVTENLVFKNKTLTFHWKRLKCNDHVISSYTRNVTTFIKKYESSKSNKISNLKALHDLFPDFFNKSRDGFEEFCKMSVDSHIPVQSSTV